jgi:hypothetical protein
MSDLRILRMLRGIDEKIDRMKEDRDRALAEIDAELEEHKGRLDTHDESIEEALRRIGRLETRFDRTLHALRTSGKKPARKG